MLSSQHVEFERRVEKFPYQLFEVFELFPLLRNSETTAMSMSLRPLTFSLEFFKVLPSEAP